MFDIGFWELLLIGVVTLLVVGPERLPAVARTAGRWVAKTRRFVAGVRADFNRELQTGDLHKLLGEQKDEINELRSLVQSTRKEFESTTSDALKAAQSGLASMEEAARDADDKLQGRSAASEDAPLSTIDDEMLLDQANLLDKVPHIEAPAPDSALSGETGQSGSPNGTPTDSPNGSQTTSNGPDQQHPSSEKSASS